MIFRTKLPLFDRQPLLPAPAEGIAKLQQLQYIGKAPPAVKLKRSGAEVLQCKHLGPSLEPEKPGCQGCAKRICTRRGTTTLGYCMTECTACTQPEPKLPPAHKRRAVKVIRFDASNLSPETGGQRLNPSIIQHDDGYLLAYRYSWNNALVNIIRLSPTFEPRDFGRYVSLNHYEASAGREDPRLFRFRGKHHISFTGWLGNWSTRWNLANMLYARLNDDLDVEAIYYPKLPWRSSWEKNHVYFDHRGNLHGVYSLAPHIVYELDEESVVRVHQTETKHRWEYGHLRGGASPVLHNGQYYHFFHGMLQRQVGRVYSLGCAVFEAKPPFRIVRITHEPLAIAENATNPGIDSDVIFPGGAVFTGGHWVIAMGVHDSWSELRFYTPEYVESMLSPI